MQKKAILAEMSLTLFLRKGDDMFSLISPRIHVMESYVTNIHDSLPVWMTLTGNLISAISSIAADRN